jgi:hypothetical protein
MVYSDYPGPSIINNLNFVVVTDPDGKRYNGTVSEPPYD